MELEAVGGEKASGLGRPTLHRSHVLGREYRHAINDLSRPTNWDHIEQAGYESVVVSFVQKWKEVLSDFLLFLPLYFLTAYNLVSGFQVGDLMVGVVALREA